MNAKGEEVGQADVFQVDEDHPYSQIIVTLQIRILRGGTTRSRLAANIYPDPGLENLAKSGLDQEQYGITDDGNFCVNFNPFWLDLNHDYPRFDSNVPNEVYGEDIARMNEALKRSVEWVLDLHRKAMQPSPAS